MSRRGLLVACLGALAAWLPTPTWADPGFELFEVTVHRTPGKPLRSFEPGRPAEEVVARREAQGPVLIVRVNVAREGIHAYTERRAPLSENEWQEIAGIVEANHLLDWSPVPSRPTPDWGSAGFSLRDGEQRDHTWNAPLRNGDAPARLAGYLARLAAARVPELPLLHLAP